MTVISLIPKVRSHRAKAKKIKEQLKEGKENFSNIKEIFRFLVHFTMWKKSSGKMLPRWD